ncbi:MAG TPA: hypothetical protein VNF47_00955 [Streptosporangiaceae bacterium]|nr:hypothetical protein [Streptosporangiaceae bacterium]
MAGLGVGFADGVTLGVRFADPVGAGMDGDGWLVVPLSVPHELRARIAASIRAQAAGTAADVVAPRRRRLA